MKQKCYHKYQKPHLEYDYRGLGFNYRMPNINAALGYAQIKKLKFIKSKKNYTPNMSQNLKSQRILLIEGITRYKMQ